MIGLLSFFSEVILLSGKELGFQILKSEKKAPRVNYHLISFLLII